MIKTLSYLKKFRDWRALGAGAAAGLVVTLAVLHLTVAAASLSIGIDSALALGAGALLGMWVAFSYCVLRIVRKLDEQNARRDLALNYMIQGLCMFDGQNRLVVWNQSV